MKVVVGLGNPGGKYDGTRHNVGFAVADYLAQSPKAGRPRGRFDADVVELEENGEVLLLVKPQTFMNLSGRSVAQAVNFYKIEPADLLVVCDDTSLPLGKLRVRAGGSHGGHNGLRSIQEHLGTAEYSRLRIGVGSAQPGEQVDYVLGWFRPTEQGAVVNAVAEAAKAVLLWATRGIEPCMNAVNGPAEPRPKKPKPPPKAGDSEQPRPTAGSSEGQD